MAGSIKAGTNPTIKPSGPGLGQIWKDVGGDPYVLLAIPSDQTVICSHVDSRAHYIEHLFFYHLDSGQCFCTTHFKAYVVESRG